MRKTWASLALVLALAACGSNSGAGAATSIEDVGTSDEQALGGAAAVSAMRELYQTALEKGQTTVTVYGPGETDRKPLYERFSERFPGIKVDGVYVVGPDYAAKLEAEFASGQHVADLVQSGDTSVAGQIGLGYFEKFDPVTAVELDRSAYSDPTGTVIAASALPFGFLYNTNEIGPDEAPAGWDDLLDPSLRGVMTSDDLTHFGGGFSTLSHGLWDGRFDDSFLQQLGAQDITFQSSSAVAGTAVATGQFALHPFYPFSFYLRDKAKGAPVEFVFPTQGGVHLSPHYLALIKGAPNPEAAKLLLTWLFSAEAQQESAAVGHYPLMPGQAGPGGFPPADELDLFKPFPLDTVNQIAAENVARTRTAFGK